MTDSYIQGEFLFLLQKIEKRREISPCGKTPLNTIQGREDRKEIMDDSILKINGKSLSFKESDIKLFDRLKHSVDEIGRVFWESGKIPDSERRQLLTDMTEGYLSVMIVLHDVLTSSLDVGYHSVRRVVRASSSAGQKLLSVFVTAGAAVKAQPWLAWEIMATYSRLVLHHEKIVGRLNGAMLSSLRKAVGNLEEGRKKVDNLGDYLTEIAMPSLQLEENIYILLDEADVLALEEYQISQLHHLLKRTKVLLEWRRPQ